ncbi:GTP-binding protein [Oscillatoriales cyanobacterium LEGE 11467]|uniref:GTP-binding protein n=1 Tax=Zarconia navalis LEGE 11467 TaxID=1828826 RepID=A0A928Z938_9CYAN|nr:GTP-binding protein [Zarconia navalis]MBE9041318.1 GTP-binding protein [Zarconia navalis LEGE 11467]
MSDRLPDSFDRELDEAIFSFSDIQAELNYKQAEAALKDLVTHLDLTPAERKGLETEIGGLESMLDKLESSTVQIAAFGMVGRGKSSLLNALVGQPIFETGPLHGVTQTSQRANWQLNPESVVRNGDIWQVSLPGQGNCQIELVDTPGLDEIEGQDRAGLARRVAGQADLILFVIAGDMTQVEYDGLSQVRDAGKPIILVFNKIDRYPEADRQAIYEQIRDRRVRELLAPDDIVMAAASPLVAQATRRSDGSMGVQLTPHTPQVEELKLKILEILHREGKSLVALNTMLYADTINDRVVRRKMEIRDRSANQIIWKAASAKALAVALNPIAVADIFSAAIVDAIAILTLSKLYGIPMTQTGAVSLLKTIALSMGGIGASELLATLGLSSLKSLLGLAAPVTGGLALGGYLSVALTQASIAGVSTYGIGQVAKAYLANGASWGEGGPKTVVSQILESLDETSILNRIKDELEAKLSRISQRKSPEEI